jgi:RND family efflux transporter MFP subunit
MTPSRPTKFRTLRVLVMTAGFTAVVVLLLLWLAGHFQPKIDPSRHGTAQAEPLGDRKLVPVEAIEVPAVESAVGTVRAVQQTTIAAEVMAKVLEVNVRAGQAVRKGEVLARLDAEELQARLQQAEAAVAAATAARDQAQTEWDRVKKLHEQNNASQIEFQRTETELKSASAALQQADQVRAAAAKGLSHTTIASPFDGIVIDKQIDVGDTAYPQKPLLTLYDPTRMQLVASVRESLIDRV